MKRDTGRWEVKKINVFFMAALVVGFLNFMPTGSAGAAIQKETGFGSTWPADSGSSVIEFTARTAKSSEWDLGHKINGSYSDTKEYTWPEFGGGETGFTLTHNSSTGEFTLALAETPASPAASTTWNSGRASCERVKDIWIRAGSLHDSYTSSITISTLDGQPIDVILTADAAGEINYLHIYGESFKDFTMSGTMSMTWTDGERTPQKTQTINLISVVFEGDTDGDGYVDGCDNCPAVSNAGQEDCNGNAVGDACDDVHPNAIEICDTIDNNCNGQNNEGLTFDVDGDTHSTPGSCDGTKDDCDDNDAYNFPGNIEVCDDGSDNNCDTIVDEGCTPPPVQSLGGGSFDSIQNAYDFIADAGIDTDTIYMQALEFTEGLTFDHEVIVTLIGGFDDSYTWPSTGWTVISGGPPALTISSGTVTLDNIILQ
jgi:hypothetical protein